MMPDMLRYIIHNFYPEIASKVTDENEQHWMFFEEITKRTIKLASKWQASGFCHGVLNTDNMSILGLTIDYGPFGFMEHFDPKFICNHSDSEGRYRYEA